MSRPRRIALVAVLLTGAVVGLAAFGGRHHRPMDPERARKFATWVVDDALDEIDATDAQRATVHTLKDARLATFFDLRAEHRAARDEALVLWDTAEPDPAKVHALVDARVDAFRKLAHTLADDALTLHRTLTPEQRAEVSQELRARVERHDPSAKE